MFKHLSGLSTSQKMLVAATVFFVAQVFVWELSEPAAHFMPDSNEYLSAATDVNNAIQDSEYSVVDVLFGARRQPGYILLLAFGETTFGDPAAFVIFVQITMLAVMALVTASLAEAFMPGTRLLAFTLMLFNPNSFALAQIMLPATVVSFCILVALWAIWQASVNGFWRYGLLAGLLMALAYLLRTDIKYLALILPIWIPLLAMSAKGMRSPVRLILVGVLAVAIFLVFNLAWTTPKGAFLSAKGETIVKSVPHFLVGNIIFLEKRYHPELSIEEASAVVAVRIDRMLRSNGLAGGSLEQGAGFYLSLIFEYPVPVLVRAIISSQANLFFSGGTQNLARLTNIELPSSHVVFDKVGQGDRLSAWWQSIQQAPTGGILLSVLAVGFAVLMRLLAFFGAIAALVQRRWNILVFTVPVIGYWAAILLFNGISRYRASIEPVLTLLAVYGIWNLLISYKEKSQVSVEVEA
jgi:hypothetical protein